MILGALFESMVVGELKKQISLLSVKPRLYHWRTYSGAEVDLIMEYNGAYYPIEIKLNTQPSRKFTIGISSFRKHNPNLNIAPGLVLAPADSFRKISDNDYTMPWNGFHL